MIIYEQPFNEKVRLFLRLELLVSRFRYHLTSNKQPDIISALTLLLELYNLSARIDLKSDMIKEIDRSSQSVRRLIAETGEQDVTLERLTDHSNQLYQLRGPLGQHLRTHTFFSTLRQRASLPGGMNSFDIPLLNYWLGNGQEVCVRDLQNWCEPFMQTADAASFLLNLVRTYCEGKNHVAQAGFFQLSLRESYHLLQIELPDDAGVYPEISAGKQRFSLRFVELSSLDERGKQAAGDVSFRLKLCAF
ncbi:MAG: cell division protein ZapD [Thiolinea sp.]